MIRYYGTKQFKPEVEANDLQAPLKDSETRTRAIQKEISTYKTIIDQLLHDSIYYQPVWDALQSDWKEQTQLVQQTFSIGLPAIKNVKKLGVSMRKLQNVSKKEENKQQRDYFKSLEILEGYPKMIKKLIRSPVRQKVWILPTFSLNVDVSLISVCWASATNGRQIRC